MELLPHEPSPSNGPPEPAFEQRLGTPPSRGVRMRVGLGAGVVLVLVAGGLAVLISALSSHPAAASTTDYSSSYSSGSGSGESSESSGDSSGDSSDSSSDGDSSSDAPVATDSSTAFVQVVGQVLRPGLYELPAGDRVVDAIAAAGGFTPKADQASLNLAQVIADGEQIVVAQVGAVAPTGTGSAGGGSGAAGGAGGSGIVDINTADATALETLDGIGPALAQRILDYRTAHGSFRSINDLQNVTGIGPKKFAAIKASVST